MANWSSQYGSHLPLGQSWVPEERAYNFSLFAEHAEEVTLLLFGDDDPAVPVLRFPMDYLRHKFVHVWFCRLKKRDVGKARYYGYAIAGPPPGPRGGNAFDAEKVLLDPYATEVHFPPGFDREACKRPGSSLGKAPLGVLRDGELPFDWQGDQRPVHESGAVVYEMHVRGFTRSPSSGVAPEHRGTFAGVIEKIPYLRELGVTIIELMPVQQFDPQEGNYWGYMSLNFFAPHQQFAARPARAKAEFQEMVRELHAAGMQVVLDVVYNHTAEGDHRGPTYSFKGIDNDNYYLLTGDPANPYWNFSGCGNTFDCGNRFARTLIVDSLRYWVTEMHVDGFRFDLASVFARNEDGSVNTTDPPLITAIRADPVLRHVHLAAEPWDAAGLYQLGAHFPGLTWHQWNGAFRDEVRRFVRGDPGMVATLMRRLYGSDDLFPDRLYQTCTPFQSINFLTCHDGFSLYDLVAYNEKHNQANGQGNTDGMNENYSWNCGHEGDHDLPASVLDLRKQQAKNLCCLLLLANGIPMFRAGDEFLDTQQGNNNPYNQDNQTSWLDWDRMRAHYDVFRFFKLMIAFRKAHPSICRSRFWRDDVRWYGVGPDPDLSHDSHTLAYCLRGASEGDDDLYVMINAWREDLAFGIEEGKPEEWQRVIDTGLPCPDDIRDPGAEEPVAAKYYPVKARSVVVLRRG